jgi:hypothetical protein
MQKRDLPTLLFGILITTVASCRTTPELPIATDLTLEPALTEAAAAQPPTATPAEVPTLPTTAGPAQTPTDGRQPLGSDRAGLALRIPTDWVNLTDQLDIPAMGNRLGINLLFAADSERTGRSLLAGKSFSDGAYVAGLVVTPPVATTPTATADPAAALVELLTAAAPTAVRLTPVTPLTSANGVSGYAIDVADGAVGLNANATELRTRVVLYTPPAAADAPPSWLILLLSASTERWSRYAPIFDEMLTTVRVAGVRPGDVAQAGNVVVRGQLNGDRAAVGATLEPAVNDLWTFSVTDERYVSLSLVPAEPQLDPTLTLLGPDRQTIARVDNGFAGVTESITDLLLTQPGVYIVEVSDFYRAPGGYDLSLALSAQPQYSGGGPIAFGQTLQGQLPAGGRHYWVFPATAGQRVSVVIEPGATTFDAVLDLYGPDGQRLVALDEGFSGDPEVLSGFALPATGEYAVLVRSFSPQGGPYTLSLDEGEQPIANFYDAGDLAYGEVRPESLQPQEAHAWFFQGQAGDHILVRVTPRGPGLDPDVWLLDANLARVAAVDAFAAGEPETIELTLSADGQYVVLVRDFRGEPGEYEIALGAAPIATPENAGALSYGDTIIGGIRPDTAVAWSFNAQAGDVIDLTVTPGESSSDIVLQLRGPDGLTALEVDAASAGAAESVNAFIVPAAGTWRVVLREYFGQTATYRLALARAR